MYPHLVRRPFVGQRRDSKSNMPKNFFSDPITATNPTKVATVTFFDPSFGLKFHNIRNTRMANSDFISGASGSYLPSLP